MAYQNVGKPRFYINTLEWLSLNWKDTIITDAYRTLPVIPKNHFLPSGTSNAYTEPVDIPDNIFTDKGFVAILGHNYQNIGGGEAHIKLSDGNWIEGSGDIRINCESNNLVSYNGFSIRSFDLSNAINFIQLHTNQYDDNISFGSVIIGDYYDMPHSPDLQLTMKREYKGIKTIETKGGSTLSNNMWKTPMWGDRNAWEVWDATQELQNQTTLGRSGRRIWTLNFSYLDNSDVFGSNQLLNKSTGNITGLDSDDYTNSNHNFNLLTDDNFYSQVIHKTNGGQLPFIFQPDSSSASYDNFAICKLDNNFQFDQVANNVYNINLTIREVW